MHRGLHTVPRLSRLSLSLSLSLSGVCLHCTSVVFPHLHAQAQHASDGWKKGMAFSCHRDPDAASCMCMHASNLIAVPMHGLVERHTRIVKLMIESSVRRHSDSGSVWLWLWVGNPASRRRPLASVLMAWPPLPPLLALQHAVRRGRRRERADH